MNRNERLEVIPNSELFRKQEVSGQRMANNERNSLMKIQTSRGMRADATINEYSEQTSRMRSSKSAVIGLIVGLLVGCGFSVSPAWAGFTVTLMQQGSNVVATGSGALDLTGLTLRTTEVSYSFMIPAGSQINTGPAFPNYVPIDVYGGNITGPTNFGPGDFTFADNGSGDVVGLLGGPFAGVAHLDFGVPRGYISGVLSGGAAWDNQNFNNLGVTPGTYEWSWGMGPDQNFTLIAVPEPRVGLLLVVGVLLLVGVRFRQFRPSRSAA
jgi:hypothetical protein